MNNILLIFGIIFFLASTIALSVLTFYAFNDDKSLGEKIGFTIGAVVSLLMIIILIIYSKKIPDLSLDNENEPIVIDLKKEAAEQVKRSEKYKQQLKEKIEGMIEKRGMNELLIFLSWEKKEEEIKLKNSIENYREALITGDKTKTETDEMLTERGKIMEEIERLDSKINEITKLAS